MTSDKPISKVIGFSDCRSDLRYYAARPGEGFLFCDYLRVNDSQSLRDSEKHWASVWGHYDLNRRLSEMKQFASLFFVNATVLTKNTRSHSMEYPILFLKSNSPDSAKQEFMGVVKELFNGKMPPDGLHFVPAGLFVPCFRKSGIEFYFPISVWVEQTLANAYSLLLTR